MANFPDKAAAPIAVTDHTKIDLGHQHVTTIDFMQFQPSMVQQMLPGSKISVNVDTFLRANAMPVPSFARCSLRHRGYFVPMRTIFRGFNDFITDTPHVPSNGGYTQIRGSVPNFTVSSLISLFTTYHGSSLDDNTNLTVSASYDPSDPNPYDFLAFGGGNTLSAFRFTVKGRQVIKILESLGYKLIFDEDSDEPLSALPLLALARIYVDWFFPQQYMETLSYQHIMRILNYDTDTDKVLSVGELYTILSHICYVQYDSDYLVSAWDSPNSPTYSTHSNFKLVNVDSVNQVYAGLTNVVEPEAGYVSNNMGNASATNRIGDADAPFITPYVTATDSGLKTYSIATPISEYLLHQLHSLTDYLKRHQLAGARSFERFLLQYGKALPAEKLNRSVYLGAVTQNLQVGDVYSSSDTEGANLGSYAGKGLSYGNGSFSYETDEFGFFIVVTSLVPNVGYCQGIDKHVRQLSRLDFFTPEFDGNGVEPVTASEVFIPQVTVLDNGNVIFTADELFNQVFGWLPRGYGYKKANDYLTGNFRLLSINGNDPSADPREYFNASGAWHTFRLFDLNVYPDPSEIVHGPDFVSGDQDFTQFKRLFYDIPSDDNPAPPDNFTMIMNFEAAMFAPVKPLWDSYDFDMSKGPKRALEVGGVKHN